ncbi:MAG: hypothetical protein JXB60_05530 [Candidatus Cloacimonetes bacterium]|nr:hypothetical protein [Candidatus Cloacimonadota bacterium]
MYNNFNCNNSELVLNTTLAHSLTENNLHSWQADLVSGLHPGYVDLFAGVFFSENMRDSLTQFHSFISATHSRDYLDKYREFALNLSWNQVEERKEFTNIDISTACHLKNFYRRYALHNDFEVNARVLNELTEPVVLLVAQYQFKLSFSLKSRIGLNLGYSTNHNLLGYEGDLIYRDYQLYDIFAYNQHRIFSELTLLLGELKFKPQLEFIWKRYLKTAFDDEFTELSYIFSLYLDFFLPRDILLYCDCYYQIADNQGDLSSGYAASVGMRYQFDIFPSGKP